jgi:hypothetical protein
MAPTAAHVAASRCLVNPKVGAEIQRLSRSLIHTALPTLIRELIELATDKSIAPRDRLKALNSLLERGGIATDKAGVNVQVGVQVNGSQAQALISEVWSARNGRLSDIPPAMSDNMKQLESDVEALAIAPPTTDPGGGRLSGSRRGYLSFTCVLRLLRSERKEPRPHSPNRWIEGSRKCRRLMLLRWVRR